MTATARSVPEWRGKTPDTAIPTRVRLRVFERCKGRCGQCDRKINAASGDKWTLEHIQALINGGENRESNLGVTCDWCLPVKNAADVAEKSNIYRKRSKTLGLKAQKPKSRFVRKLDGTTELRGADTGKMR